MFFLASVRLDSCLVNSDWSLPVLTVYMGVVYASATISIAELNLPLDFRALNYLPPISAEAYGDYLFVNEGNLVVVLVVVDVVTPMDEVAPVTDIRSFRVVPFGREIPFVISF